MVSTVRSSLTVIFIDIHIRKKSAFTVAHDYLNPMTIFFVHINKIDVSFGSIFFSPLLPHPILRLRQI